MVARIITKARQRRLEYQVKERRIVTIHEVADAVGISYAALANIELQKTTRIDFDTLLKLCRFYSVGVEDMLGVEESVEEDNTAEASNEKNETPGLAQAYAA